MDLLDAAHHPVSLVAAALCLLVLLTCRVLLRRLQLRGGGWPSRGRWGLRPPVAGTILHMLKNFPRLYDYMTEFSRRYRTFRMIGFFRSHIYTVDPANVEYVLKSNFHNYGKGPYLYDILKDLLGDGIFAVDGEKWNHQRKVASHAFSTRVLRDYSSVVFRKNATKVAQIISDYATSQQMFDVQGLLMKAAMDSIFEVGFGENLDILSGSREDAYAFAKAFDDASSLTLKRCFDLSWKMKRLLNVGSEAALKRNVKVIDGFVYKVIRRRREQMATRYQSDLMKRADMLSRFLMDSELGAAESRDDKYLRDITLSFILAGKDTTASTLSWFLYMLCKHPVVQEKIVQEVEEATETSRHSPFMQNFTEEALNRMQYLHAALTETLRLHPIVPMDAKFCFSDDVLPDGFTVKGGDMVDYQPYPMGRMEALWGADAEEFRPERWLDEDGKFQPESPFKFTAFQSGPRICLGKEFAYRQMKILGATLLHRFTFRLSDEKKVVHYTTMLTLQIEGGLHIRAYHR
ncbi:hypothetical protein Taro_018959 [Colocasia esculenta]|uniref:Cytochrome P450 704C1 n=1 Tax=Colocasia esculenta TaxID=4460 RepID=A0A843US32_COLES|nr:hypothetical protein [Colocasia esculenta]